MTLFKNISCLIAGLLFFAVVQSQPVSYSNLRSKKISVSAARVDSFSIVPRTFFIKDYDTTFYKVDEINASITWKKKPAADSVEVMYRVFPYKLNAVAKRFTYDSVMNNFITAPFVFNRNNRPVGSPGTELEFAL